MTHSALSDPAAAPLAHVAETRFGVWFQRTEIWRRYVVQEAVAELAGLVAGRLPGQPRVVDAGCGDGVAFAMLLGELGAREVVGLDVDAASIARAQAEALRLGTAVRALHADAAQMPVETASVDVVFCHQLLHHATEPGRVLRECHRVLRPGGWLLVAESCREFLDWWPVRLLFRHPVREHLAAPDYVGLVADAGFGVAASDVLTPMPWWSLRDLGVRRRLGLTAREREPGQVRIAARHVPRG